ncbi:MAG: phosphodiester glycosidase family protein [Firmicutes bacterium]|nr:phosphodiester glycosidase family protein [Bacillota bacterium]
MKRELRIFLLPVILLLLAPLQGAAALPDDLLHASNIGLAENVRLTQGIFWSSTHNDRVTENYFEYTPNDTVTPIIAYGNYIYGGNPLARLSEIVENRGQHVIAAVNADYFNMSTRVPISTVIENGVLKGNEGSAWVSVGFYEDGRILLGRQNLAMSLNIYDKEYIIGKLNKELTAKSQSIQLFSSDYDLTTKAAIPSVYAVLRVTEGYLGVNRTVTAYVESSGTATEPIDIPSACLVAALSQDSDNEIAKAALAAFAPGQQVSITIKGDAAWNDIVYAVGGGEKLLTNGQVVAPEFSAGSKESFMPRTAIGLRADGSYIFYTVDGRQKGYSVGLTLTEVAQRLIELGCIEAVNLDGGGSTTLSALYPGQESLKTINKPSDGSLRTCANYILLINHGSTLGEAEHLHIYPYDSLILAGASVDFTLTATNADYNLAKLPYGSTNFFIDNEALGRVDENGRFTAGRMPLSGYIRAQSGAIEARARITVVDKVDSISMIYADSGNSVGQYITLYGGGSVKLGMSGFYNHLNVKADAASFKWDLSEKIGAINEEGLLTANPDADGGEGILTASLGEVSVSVTVRVSNRADLIEDFENFAGWEKPGLAFRPNADKSLVRYGTKSGVVEYDFSVLDVDDLDDENHRLIVPLDLKVTDNPNYLNFWLLGDASDNQLTITLQQGEIITSLPAAILDFAGWQYISLPLPSGITGLDSLIINQNNEKSGAIYLDQIMSAHGHYTDNEPPLIEVEVGDDVIIAVITDVLDKELKASNIRLTYDGLPLAFNYDPASSKLNAVLPPDDGCAHRLSVVARDKSGNVARCSVDIEASEVQTQPFIDMNGHWALRYTTYLYQQGIVNGIAGDKGFSYAPDTNMNRAQFAVIMCNWLGVDTEQYFDLELPFADVLAIGEWAYPAISAMYALGVTKGSALNGQLYYNPASPISRAEAMTMIGRTLERGYAESTLSFVDTASVPEWAAPYVRILVELQVVSGMDGNRLAPSAYVTRAQVAKMLYSLI